MCFHFYAQLSSIAIFFFGRFARKSGNEKPLAAEKMLSKLEEKIFFLLRAIKQNVVIYAVAKTKIV